MNIEKVVRVGRSAGAAILVLASVSCGDVAREGQASSYLIITSLQGYELRVSRVTHASDGLSYVELSETFEVDGQPTTYPECIVFERDDAGLIGHVSVFIKQPGGDAPVEGGRAG